MTPKNLKRIGWSLWDLSGTYSNPHYELFPTKRLALKTWAHIKDAEWKAVPVYADLSDLGDKLRNDKVPGGSDGGNRYLQ